MLREEGDYLILDFDGREYKTLREYYENGHGSRVTILLWYHIFGQTVDLNTGLVNGKLYVNNGAKPILPEVVHG